MSWYQWVGAILALGVLIIVHESGHYLVARWCKMRVERFSLGFGPAILKWKRGETQFQIAPIPLGGFVQITGMNPHEDFDPQDPNVYPNRPTWQRFLTIFAGPFTNLLFSIVLIFVVFATAGVPTTPRYAVDTIVPAAENSGKPVAAEGILQPGDKILAFNDKPIWLNSENGFQARVQESKDQPIKLTVLRDDRQLDLMITSQYDQKEKAYRLGIKLGMSREWKKVGIGIAAVEAFKFPWIKSAEMLGNLVDIVRKKAPPDLHGPVGITRMIASTLTDAILALEFLAFLNVALGLFNLLPVPALDGGRLAFLGYELVTRRRPNPRIEAAIHMVGFVALMLLIVIVTIKGN
jgi:regulator of sigma E protease